MGVLDDAIREHLELKRRRGADPGSLKRDEDEALGEVVREPTQRELEQQAHETPAAAQPPAAEAVADQPTAAFAPEEVAEALGHTEPEPETEEPPVPSAAPESIEAAQAAPDEAPADDELASTPEFMEDAPEHDKLWFEQKPPKDFDF